MSDQPSPVPPEPPPTAMAGGATPSPKPWGADGTAAVVDTGRPEPINSVYMLAAQLSIGAWLIALAASRGMKAAKLQQPLAFYVAVGVAVLLGLGILMAVVSLLGIRRHGASRILRWAIPGFCINTIFAGLFGFAIFEARAAKYGPPQFTLTMPAAYAEFPEGLQDEGALRSYRKGEPGDDAPDIYCQVLNLGGTIGHEDLSAAIAGNPNATLLKAEWKGHQIDLVRLQEDYEGTSLIVFNAQVPLRPKAIQIKFLGVADLEEQMLADLKEVLAHLDGKTNW